MYGLRAELQGIRAIAFDLDGVLYQANTPIPHAARTVAAVRGAGLHVRFVTNTTSCSRRLIVEKLERLGFQANAEEIFCPARGAVAWLQRQGASASFFVPSPALEDFEGVPQDDERPDAVVIGDLGADWTFESLNERSVSSTSAAHDSLASAARGTGRGPTGCSSTWVPSSRP